MKTVTVNKFELKEMLTHFRTAFILLGLIDKSDMTKECIDECEAYIRDNLTD